jgi:hypothetical protein
LLIRDVLRSQEISERDRDETLEDENDVASSVIKNLANRAVRWDDHAERTKEER